MQRHRALPVWSMVFGLVLLAGVARAEEEKEHPKISTLQVRELATNLTRIHLTQHSIDHEFMRRMMIEFAKRLDPSKTIYLQSEVDARVKKTPEELSAIAKQLKEGDLAYFEEWIKDFQERFQPREGEFLATLRDRTEEIKKKVTQEEAERHKGDEWRATHEEREQRMMILARWNFEFYKSYQPEADAIEQTLQTMARMRERRGKLDPAADAPTETIKAFMSALDPHSEYMDAKETDDFHNSMARSFSGIGVQIRTCLAGAQIVDVIKNFPAWKSGKIEVKDQIIAVEGTPLANMPLDEVVKRIKGEKGTEVKITLRKAPKEEGGEPRIAHVTLVRDTIELADIRVTGKAVASESGRIGVITVESFYEDVAGDVKKRIKELQEEGALAGLVLDLRNNGGGYLEEAIKLAGLFITTGPVVAVRDNIERTTKHQYDADEDIAWEGPLVVMVNQFSASASEIVSGTLQDYGRAFVVGPSHTHGKGTVQKVIDLKVLNMPGSVRITVQQFFVAGGQSVQLQGVTPDIAIPGRKVVEESYEKALPGAIPAATIESAIGEKHADFVKYQPFKKRVLPLLSENSAKRVAENKDFEIFKKEGDEKDPEQVAEDEKKDFDPQRDEAVKIAADTAALWANGGAVAKNAPADEPATVK